MESGNQSPIFAVTFKIDNHLITKIMDIASPTRRPLFLMLLTAFTGMTLSAQPTAEDFLMSGDTYRTLDDCYRLTEEEDYSSGSIWYKYSVNLQEPFAIELSLMLGCQDDIGADGMVFVFSPTSQPYRVGYRGEGIGFGGLVPSVGIEVDTWQNFHLADPAEDHLAFLLNGRVGHFNDISRPVLIPNIEDCKRHKFAVRWDPVTQRLSVEIDRQQVAAARFDMVDGIFGGQSEVYWGVTAATGRYNNYHEVCFERLSDASPLPALDDFLERTRPDLPLPKGK